MNNFNSTPNSNDNNTMDTIKNMLNNNDLSSLLSQVPPDVMQNIGTMLNQHENNTPNSNQQDNEQNIPNLNVSDLSSLLSNLTNSNNQNTQNNNNNTQNNSSNFDFSNIDMKTIMKMTSALSKMNSGDSRSNLLKSLKPFLRDTRKSKIDQYSNLLNMTKIADVLKSDNQGNSNVSTE